MFGFIKKVFFTTMTFFSFNGIGFNPLNANSLEYVSINNREYRTRTNKNNKCQQ